ncbi:MAG: hypothetical protein HKO14_06415 [Silicimonas sp.]|nr:hypothetical protein [Silicimonas sp.]
MIRRYPDATRWLCDQVEDVIVDGRLDFPESTYEEMRIGQQIGVEWSGADGKAHYSVSDDAARRLAVWSSKSAGYFDAVARICATNIGQGAPLPFALRAFVSSVLVGETCRPRVGHRQPKKNWMERAFLFGLGRSACEKFGLTLTSNDEAGHAHSACDALAEALTICGRTTKYGEIKRLFVHRDFARFREENAKVGEDYKRKKNMKRIVEALMSKDTPETPLTNYLRSGLGNT